MEELEKAFETVRAIRDCPAVRRLLFDVWIYARDRGESEGMRLLAVIRESVRDYQQHETAMLKR